MDEQPLARFIDRWTVEYIRIYPHPIERVWRAITDPAELAHWFIAPTKWEFATGGAYAFGGEEFSGTIIAIDRPRFIRLGDPRDPAWHIQYELEEVAEGTRLRFEQRFSPRGDYAETPNDLGGDLPGGPDTPWKPGFVGGWHEFFDSLRDHLDGAPLCSRLPPTEFNAIVTSWLGQAAQDLEPGLRARIADGLRRHERWNELNKIYRAHIRATLPPS